MTLTQILKNDAVIAVSLVAGALFAVGALLGTAIYTTMPTYYTAEPKFFIGQDVTLRLAPDAPAMVLRQDCTSLHPDSVCMYRVRIAVPQDRTDVSLLGADGPITHQAVSTLWVYEYELKQGN